MWSVPSFGATSGRRWSRLPHSVRAERAKASSRANGEFHRRATRRSSAGNNDYSVILSDVPPVTYRPFEDLIFPAQNAFFGLWGFNFPLRHRPPEQQIRSSVKIGVQEFLDSEDSDPDEYFFPRCGACLCPVISISDVQSALRPKRRAGSGLSPLRGPEMRLSHSM